MTAAAVENVSHLPAQPPLPAFEGQQVDYSTVKVSGLSSLENVDNVVISTDDRVRLVGEFKVTSVRHFVDGDGKLVREQVLKPLVVTTCPWDPTDPTDDGIVRARP